MTWKRLAVVACYAPWIVGMAFVLCTGRPSWLWLVAACIVAGGGDELRNRGWWRR